MLFIQGVMSAISAGMLIYAATVEMIAGDFVFGDVDGGHHHHHHEPHADEGSAPVQDHAHAHDYDDRPNQWADETGAHKRGRSHNTANADVETQRQDMGDHHDPQFVPLSPLADESGDDHLTTPRTTKQSSMAKRVLAIVSLLMGVVMMILVGIGE